MTEHTWRPGDRARISAGAFGDSQEPCDVATRGNVGVLIEQVDDDLWFWRGDDETENYPKTSELERVDEAVSA